MVKTEYDGGVEIELLGGNGPRYEIRPRDGRAPAKVLEADGLNLNGKPMSFSQQAHGTTIEFGGTQTMYAEVVEDGRMEHGLAVIEIENESDKVRR